MSVTIEVKCDGSNDLFWREQGGSTWTQLAANPDNAPIIAADQPDTTTFELEEHSSSTYPVLYKPSTNGTPQSLPAQLQLSPGDGQHVFFSRDTTTQRWYAGYIRVPPAR